MGGQADIFLDESGDLGWKFDQPYRHGGSSRYLTIGAVVAPDRTERKVSRLVRDLYQSRNWAPGKEKKWSEMTQSARCDFAERALRLFEQNNEIGYYTITVRKERVWDHIRADANKLYNWMIKDCLLPVMAEFDNVWFVPDERSVKVESGKSLHDYLQAELWFTLKVKTNLITRPSESSGSHQLQFADMLAGAVQSYFEDSEKDAFEILRPSLNVQKIFF